MKLVHMFVRFAFAGVVAMALAGGAHAADRKTTNTLLGAGLGAAAGAVLSEGDPMLTLGGAAAGGVLGNVLTEDHNKKWNGKKQYRHQGWDHGGRNWNRGHYKKVKHSRGKRHHRGHHRR